MCGRARCTLNPQQIARACGIQPGDDPVATAQMDRFRPSYNLSPGSYMPVVVRRGGGDDGAAATIHCMKWGLVPGFTKKTEKPDHFRMFNARSESVQEKASFRRLVPKNRCLVAAEGFYEWKKDGSKRQPYYIHFKDQRPLVFAALYDRWESSDGEILHTFTILTTCSSPVLLWLHDRMPVILGNKDSINEWLDGSRSKFDSVLVPYEAPDLVWYAVTPAIGKTSFDGPECIKELKPAEKNPISKFFSKKSDVKVKLGPEARNSDETSATELTENLKEEETCTEDTKDCKTILRHDGVNKEVEFSETIKEEPCGEEDRECLKKFKDSEVKKEADLSEAMKEVPCGKEGKECLIKSQDSEVMKEADLSETIKEEPSGEEAKECLKRYSDSEIKKEVGANRDFEKMATVSHPKVLKPTSKKKSRSIKAAGDGQSTLLSFFGKS